MGNTPGAVREPDSQPRGSQQVEGLSHPADVAVRKRKRWILCYTLVKISYVTASLINILLAIILMSLSVAAAITMKIFLDQHTGMLGALIVLTVIGAVILSITIYAMVAVLRNQCKHVHVASLAFLVLIVIQAIILGVSMRITVEDEAKLSNALVRSFQQARQDNPAYMELWSALQSSLNCCGVFDPNDYLNSNGDSTPNVPISCCPAYDPSRSDIVQENERKVCKARKEYYKSGCVAPVIELVKESASRVVVADVLLILMMVKISILGAIWVRKCNRRNLKGAATADIPVDNLPKP